MAKDHFSSEEERQRRIKFVIEEYNGILPYTEAFYIQSIIYAATAADESFERFAFAFVKDRHSSVVVLAVQEALTHAASLSRFFWPARSKNIAGARATKLRAAFKMDGSALENRDLRNALEHFDEKLDEFLLADPSGFFFPGPMVDCHTLADEQASQIFRLVDPIELVFVIFGQKYYFADIIDEVRRIKSLAEIFDKNGCRIT